MAATKRFVYILRSESNPTRYYTGLTSNMHLRLADHNEGSCRHTSSGVPWKFDVVIEFPDQARAVELERYLKSGSGVAFARRHLRSRT